MKDRTLLAEITDINFNKVTEAYAEHLLQYVGLPIAAKYGQKLKDLEICSVKFYEQEYDYMGSPTEKIFIGEVLSV